MNKKKMNSFLKLSLILFIALLAGGISGFFLGYNQISFTFKNFYDLLPHLIGKYGFIVFIYCLLAIFSLEITLKKMKTLGNRLLAAEDEEADLIEGSLDRQTIIGNILSTLFTSISMLVFGTYVYVLTNNDFLDSLTNLDLMFYFGAYLFLAAEIIYCAFWTIRLVKFCMKIYPGKYGDPTSLRFQEQWIESCDEAEQDLAYRAAFSAYAQTNKFLSILMAILLLANLVFPLGLLPLLTCVVIISYLNITYQFGYLKAKKSRKEVNG